MRVRAAVGAVLASGVVLLAGWEIGAQQPTISSSSAGSASASTSTSSGTATTTTASGTGVTDGIFNGSVQQTRFGSVQVAVTISGGKITDVKALKLTDDGGRSVQISNYAAPVLRSEVLASQSATVDSVSGATYTSDGYLGSLQAALDSAHFA